MSSSRRTPWGALAGATVAGAMIAGFVAWQLQLQAVNREIEDKLGVLKKLVVTGKIPPTEEVMDYLASRSEVMNRHFGHWRQLAVVPLPEDKAGRDPQLHFQERLHDVQGAVEELTSAQGLSPPEQLGFPKELPPSDAVPRLLVQLALIEDAARLILAQGVTSLSSFKVDDPETVFEAESEEPFLMRLPIRVRMKIPLPAMVNVLGALQHTMPMIDLQGIRLTAGMNKDELDMELILCRYLAVTAPPEQAPKS